MGKGIVIHWFRQDLRLGDNPALCAAAKAGKVLPVYILDEENAGEFRMGAASRVWLYHSLRALNASLEGALCVYRGDAGKLLLEIAKRCNARAVYWNRCYESWRIARDKKIKEVLAGEGIEAESFNGSLLWEPWEALKDNGEPYKVFTPFYRKGCLKAGPPRTPLPMPENLSLTRDEEGRGTIEGLGLLPEVRWDKALAEQWEIGEEGAEKRLDAFLEEGLAQYKEGRNYPAQPYVSRLSPYLHFGEMSPNQAWHAVRLRGENKNTDHFCSELGWREFSYSLLYHFPDLPRRNLQEKFNAFPWRKDKEALTRWQQGRTGYPLVDAGMRELWQTGYMHNRIRMVVGSFLVKNLLLHWHEGEKWFWDCLLDADLANNSASWQWIAGCGADAAPYFRVFNPVTQGHKFDPEGEYTKRFVPELARLPVKHLFSPWDAPEEELKKAGVALGENYPKPLVDVKKSRERALAAFASLKGDVTNA